MPDTWLAIATKSPGLPQKQGYGNVTTRVMQGICAHSMEGSLNAAIGELMNPNRQASWTFSNPKLGKLLQHYPIEAITWASGSQEANKRYLAIESEGVAGELLNPNQIKNMQDLMKALPIPTWKRGETIFEHREMVVLGSAPTACPSNRYPWPQILLQEDDFMAALTETEQKELLAKTRDIWNRLAGWKVAPGDGPDNTYAGGDSHAEIMGRLRSIDAGK